MARTWMIPAGLGLVLAAGLAHAATIRPGGDPAADTVIWADPFDYYNQWAWDNRNDTANTRGTVWQGGPIPPLADPAGSLGYPTKAPSSGCGTVIQTTPAMHEMARAQWFNDDCPAIVSPGGVTAERGSFEANMDPNCNKSGETVTTRGEFGYLNYTWGMGGSYSSMSQFRHRFADRIQAMATRRGLGVKNAINGTDANPMTVICYMHTGTAGFSVFDNVYLELTLGDETAPTDYIWRGNPTAPAPGTVDPEYCPQGPYPIVCQQVREINGSVSEDGSDLVYVNNNCPALIPPYDPNTNTGKTWRSFAFGLLAIIDKDPCGLDEQGVDAHKPTSDHWVVFDGNKWRQLRNNRFSGLAQSGTKTDGTAWSWPVPFPWDTYMAPGTGPCNNFVTANGDTRIVLKIITDYVLIYASNAANSQEWHAMIPRVYKGPFDTIRLGVGPGCELDPATGTCKQGGTPSQCLTYSKAAPTGYNRVQVDSMSILNGELVYADTINGACCHNDGTCNMTDQLTCVNDNARWDGVGTSCGQLLCCPKQYGDTDRDGDVDMDDFSALQRCLTIGQTGTNLVSAGCKCLDADANGKIDLDDVTHFSACASGEGIAANPGCWTRP